jgi:hypothetical protein
MPSIYDYIENQNRQIIEGLNAINNNLSVILDVLKKKDDILLKVIASAGLPGFPYSNEQMTIGVLPSLIWRNDTKQLQRIRIENLDPGQDLTLGPGDTVSITNGFTVNVRLTQDFTLAPGQAIFGVVPAATIQIAVGRIQDAYVELINQ